MSIILQLVQGYRTLTSIIVYTLFMIVNFTYQKHFLSLFLLERVCSYKFFVNHQSVDCGDRDGEGMVSEGMPHQQQTHKAADYKPPAPLHQTVVTDTPL